MGRCSKLMMALVLMMSFNFLAEAQSNNIPSCADKLFPCVNYMNSTKPPNSCCDPLKQTVATQLPCLCNLYFTPGLLTGFGINVTDAIELSHRCGVPTDINSCKASAAPPSSGGTSTVPGTPGGENGGAGRVAVTGLSFLLSIWASMLF